jgi:hypothetical protein
MNDKDHAVYEALLRVNRFGADHAAAFDPTSNAAADFVSAAALEAAYLDDGRLSGAHVARQLQGVVLKDSPEDGKRLRAYIDHIVKERAGRSGVWKEFYQAARSLKLG